MSKRLFWDIVRIGIVYYLMPLFAAVLIMTSGAPIPLYINLNPEALVSVFTIIALVGWFFLKKTPFKSFGKLLLMSLPGVVVLAMYHKVSVSFSDVNYTAYTIMLFVLFLIAAIYFMFPVRQIKPFLMLIPVSATSWFMLHAIYKPVNLAYGAVASRDKLTANQYQELWELIPQLCVSSLQTSSLAIPLVLIYYVSLYGSNPKKAYERLKTQFMAKTKENL
ncbi:hypothetical protein [Rheinheimera soli]|uniref:Uncharacterized protein n=1 Tax=Rheinheimera soli TaxID=443616 RepID=A0ABU1W0F0_9GAMM|nr:hypothetical protein [Rheinheimera soli]MDR7121438.1 hypothetical protein [Rheinheimera soli]